MGNAWAPAVGRNGVSVRGIGAESGIGPDVILTASMIEGLWSVEFESLMGYRGTGVLVFFRGGVLGGDDQYYYKGTYVLDGPELRAAIQAFAYVADPHSVFGTSDRSVSLVLAGLVSEGGNKILARSAQPDGPLVAKLIKREELP